MTGPVVVELTASRTHALRRDVLRGGDPAARVVFDGDDLPTTVHLGVELDGRLVATSTWLAVRHPDHPALAGVQLRGMATAPDLQGAGIGGVLLAAGLERMRERGIELVWARARDTALAFYQRHGFEIFGRGYVDLATGLPHHDVIRHL